VQYRDVVRQIANTANQHVYRVLITDADQVNAFAGLDNNGNPTIGITLKMLRLVSDDKDALAALVGHEVSHLKLQHAKEGKGFNDDAEALATINGIVLQMMGVPMARSAAGLGKGAVVAAYSRENESEADATGIRLAFEAGYDPYGAVRLFQMLEQAGNGVVIPFLSTHPSSSERIDSMKTIAAQLRSSGNTESSQLTANADSRRLTRAATQPVSTSDVPASGSIRRNIWGITFSGEKTEQVRVVAIGAGVDTSLRVGDIVESCESSGSGTTFMVVSTLDDLRYCQPQALAKKWSAIDSYRLRARRLGSFLIATVQP